MGSAVKKFDEIAATMPCFSILRTFMGGDRHCSLLEGVISRKIESKAQVRQRVPIAVVNDAVNEALNLIDGILRKGM